MEFRRSCDASTSSGAGPLRDIAKEHGCVPSAVHKALVRHDIALRRPGLPGQGRAPLELDGAALRGRHARGESVSQIARDLGVARATFARDFHRNDSVYFINVSGTDRKG
jgi:transposase-like protein